ncbi:DUF6498-containing protein [Brumimicrobium mesophilum]|uniref:DUF6498-containing protein n=1 Tax=Brumimicrobium mesophilum TaxID=392717 RepID=UPI000D144789|nr:DUF6498-containing protein [Brumimicrobium mesophilum]
MGIFKSISFNRIDTIAIVLFSVYALLKGEITVFYMLHLFWWQTLIHVIVNTIKTLFIKRSAPYRSKVLRYFGENMFLLIIYLIFVVLLFGIVLNFNNNHLAAINMEVILFMNWSFNFNLIVFLITAIFFDRNYVDDVKNFTNAFFPRNIILHISIILGAFLHFFVIYRFPNLFASEINWGSVLVISPFLILRVIFDIYVYPINSKKNLPI